MAVIRAAEKIEMSYGTTSPSPVLSTADIKARNEAQQYAGRTHGHLAAQIAHNSVKQFIRLGQNCLDVIVRAGQFRTRSSERSRVEVSRAWAIGHLKISEKHSHLQGRKGARRRRLRANR